MIIKTTFNDNDYTNILENYWNGFWFNNYYTALNIMKTETNQDFQKYKDKRIEAEELLEKAFYNEDKMTISELRKFEEIIKESILAYIKLKENYEYLKKNLQVNMRLSITDKNQNGEVVYYFLKQKKFITM